MCLYSTTPDYKIATSPIICWKVLVKYRNEYRGPYYDQYVYGQYNECKEFEDHLTSVSNNKTAGYKRKYQLMHSGFLSFVKNIFRKIKPAYIAYYGFHSYKTYEDAYDVYKWVKKVEMYNCKVEIVGCCIPCGAKYFEGGINDEYDNNGYCSSVLEVKGPERNNGYTDEIGHNYSRALMKFENSPHKKSDTLFVLIDNPYEQFKDDRYFGMHFKGCFQLSHESGWVLTNMELIDVKKRILEDLPEYKYIIFESSESRRQRMAAHEYGFKQ